MCKWFVVSVFSSKSVTNGAFFLNVSSCRPRLWYSHESDPASIVTNATKIKLDIIFHSKCCIRSDIIKFFPLLEEEEIPRCYVQLFNFPVLQLTSNYSL